MAKPQVVPTINVANASEFAARLTQVAPFAGRIHVDITDGEFASSHTIGLAQLYCPEGVELDLHLMLRRPAEQLESAIALKPNLVIIHAEAEGNHAEMFAQLQAVGVRAGLALLPATQPADCDALLQSADHALVFTGHLGYNGGELDEAQLPKLADIKCRNNKLETSVDGGIHEKNIKQIVAAGADVLNVGAALADSVDATATYHQLCALVEGAA